MIDVAATEPRRPAPARTADGAPGDDLFALGRAAAAAAKASTGGRVVFSRAKQLLGTGAWRGPRDAAEAYVEEEDLAAIGGIGGAREAGVRTLVAQSRTLLAEARAAGLRCLLRLPFKAGDAGERVAALAAAQGFDGVLPTPVGEPLGLDTLRFFAQCRLDAPARPLLADFARLGHRLAQMTLGFGADELFGPIVPERALRLGDNAGNPAMTRKEAATLIRGAGLIPCERHATGVEEYQP